MKQQSMLSMAAAGLLALGSYGAGASEVSIIPNPLEVKQASGEFTIAPGTVITYNAAGIANEAASFAARFREAAGFELKCVQAAPSDSGINLELLPGGSPDDEGYSLEATPKQVKITAKSPAGIFYGLQTLRQLLPVAIEERETAKTGTIWFLPCVSIKDAPRFRWRNLMIDSARMFPSVDMMKRYIDLMAQYKMNLLHWHLTDDQGWRIEIKKYPELTKTGAFRRSRGKSYGGFYTQDEIRDIVKYASERHVTIVPEFDMPGHATAAVVSYPWLACTGTGKPRIPSSAGIFLVSYCPGSEKTAQFIRDVLEEMCELFPGPFFHIGGDECDKKAWEACTNCRAKMKEKGFTKVKDLHGVLIMLAHDYLKTKNKRIIAWDEVTEIKDLPQDVVVQVWRDRLSWHPKFEDTAKNALERGNDVIISPWNRSYLCYPHTSLLSNKKAYNFDPMIENISQEQAHRIFGTGACLWTDMIFRIDLERIQDYFDHYLFPRMLTHSETGWSAQERRNYEEYLTRLDRRLAALSAAGVRYGYLFEDIDPSLYRKAGEWSLADGGGKLKFDVSKFINQPGMYAFCFQYASGPEAMRITKAKLLENGKSVAEDIHEGSTGFLNAGNVYYLTLAEVKPGAKYELVADANDKGRNQAAGDLRVIMLPPMHRIGEWKSETFNNRPKVEAVYDVTPFIKAGGEHKFKFIYMGGNHATVVNSAELLENGKSVDKDVHQAVCGAGHENNDFIVKLPEFKSGAKYELKVELEGKGGTATSGVIWKTE